MTDKDKKLLLDDLAKRLGNDIKMGDNRGHIGTLKVIDLIHNTIGLKITNIYSEDSILTKGKIDFWKPYLRPMSSMTEKESNEYRMFIEYSYNDFTSESTPCVYVDKIENYINWLNAHHFDYRGLIEMGLALEAPEGMYKID